MFDLAQILHFMPFLMHLSRLGTGTTSTQASEPPRLVLCLQELKQGSFTCKVNTLPTPAYMSSELIFFTSQHLEGVSGGL